MVEVTRHEAKRVLTMIGFQPRCEQHQRSAELVTIAMLETLRAALAGNPPRRAEVKP